MRHVTLRQLRTFTEVMRSGSFAAAAQALHLTPPAVTVQMRELEQRAGLPLVRAHGRAACVPPKQGAKSANAAQRIELALAECARCAERRCAGLQGGHVAIGVVSTAKYFAPQALGAFSRALSVGGDAAGGRQPRHHHRGARSEHAGPRAHRPAAGGSRGGQGAHRAASARHRRAAGSSARAAQARCRPRRSASETFLVREPGSGTRGLMERFFAEAKRRAAHRHGDGQQRDHQAGGDGGSRHRVPVGAHGRRGAGRWAARRAGRRRACR